MCLARSALALITWYHEVGTSSVKDDREHLLGRSNGKLSKVSSLMNAFGLRKAAVHNLRQGLSALECY